LQFCWVGSREGLAVTRSWGGRWFSGANEFQAFENFRGAGWAVLGLGCEKAEDQVLQGLGKVVPVKRRG
jgi:hypothetical protein